jgi:beta propeller repeat protein
MITKSTLSFTRLIIVLLLFTGFCFMSVSASVITPVTTNGSMVHHGDPAVDGNTIVWSDDREGGVYATFLYTITSGTETRISPAVSYSSQLPRKSGNLVVYQDDSTFTPLVYLYNISSGLTDPITPDLNGQSTPVISGSHIVWQDFRLSTPAIYINGTSPGSETALSPVGSTQEFPDIHGDLVVWQDDRNGNKDIYLYNLTSGTETQITSDIHDQTYPAIFGTRIVWMDNRNGGNNEIFINGTAPGLEYSITPDGQAADHTSPSIFSSRVIWNQGATSIYMNDTSLSSSSLIPIDTLPQSYPLVPRISNDPVYGDRIVWQETSIGNEIYLYTSGASGTCPVAGFTHDFVGGSSPVTVRFSDQSTPGATHWLWDFGDGSVSVAQNPGHQYLDNRSYDVSLTVGNPYCRNTTTMAGSVVVGRPVADFTASPTSEIVPATVQFSDHSSGMPTDWLWDFGDGATSVLQSPSHTYTTVGTYTVTMTATNAYGSSDRTRPQYISVLKGANRVANTTISGLTIAHCTGSQTITVDTTILAASLIPNSSVLELMPPDDRGFKNITIYALDGVGFIPSGSRITGNVTGVHLESEMINPTGFSPAVGSPVSVNYSTDLPAYPCNALLTTKVWENAVASDNVSFEKIALDSHFSHYSGTAYTAKISRINFPSTATARLFMSVNSGWVASFTDGRNQIYIERISDDRATGEVLGTRYVAFDPVHNLDYFEAGSPHGLSTFGLSSLSGSGNPFQLITLSVTSHVNPPEPVEPAYDPSAGVESGSTTAAGAGTGRVTNPPATSTPAPPTPVPPDPGTSAKVYTNANGLVTQATRLLSTNGRATVTIREGVVVKDAGGNPLTEISIKALSPGSLPAVPSGSPFTFAGMAYDLGPDGATFSPPIALAFTLPQAEWGKDYSVQSFDIKSGTWKVLPTTFDAATGTVTADIGHLSVFALFTEPRASPATPEATPVPLPPAPQVKAQPPATAVSIFTNMMSWASDLVVNNAIIPVVVAILAIAGYLVAQGRFPGSGQ